MKRTEKVEIQVTECDICGKTDKKDKSAAFYTCDICGRDFCSNCGYEFTNDTGIDDEDPETMNELYICDDCLRKIKKVNKKKGKIKCE